MIEKIVGFLVQVELLILICLLQKNFECWYPIFNLYEEEENNFSKFLLPLILACVFSTVIELFDYLINGPPD